MTAAPSPARPSQLELELFPRQPTSGERRRTARPVPDGGPPADLEKRLFERLDLLLDGRLRSLDLTLNRSRILSSKSPGPEDPAGIRLRIHRCFTHAPRQVLSEVAVFCGGRSQRARPSRRRRALAAIRAYFDRHSGNEDSVEGAARPATPLNPRGEFYDLSPICRDLKERYFKASLATLITWGRRPARAARGRRRGRCRTLQLGSYSEDRDLIRIHPILDDERTPPFVIEAIVYHELLHADLPPAIVGGRRSLHGPEFRRRERIFPHHDEAEEWISRNLSRLLRDRS